MSVHTICSFYRPLNGGYNCSYFCQFRDIKQIFDLSDLAFFLPVLYPLSQTEGLHRSANVQPYYLFHRIIVCDWYIGRANCHFGSSIITCFELVYPINSKGSWTTIGGGCQLGIKDLNQLSNFHPYRLS